MGIRLGRRVRTVEATNGSAAKLAFTLRAREGAHAAGSDWGPGHGGTADNAATFGEALDTRLRQISPTAKTVWLSDSPNGTDTFQAGICDRSPPDVSARLGSQPRSTIPQRTPGEGR